MATYKVPQDVEAEDKLVGPFSFRQFIYLIIAALAGLLAYGLWSLFWALVFIPLPIMGFFLIIALPLRQDQPMETYVTALVQFFLKPRLRLWDPEGDMSLVEITAPKVAEGPVLKDISGREASERLRYLARVVDTHGWATRGLTSATSNVSLNDTIVAEAETAEDMFDASAGLTQHFDNMITQSDVARKEAIVQNIQSALNQPNPTTATTAQPVAPLPASHFVSNVGSAPQQPATPPVVAPQHQIVPTTLQPATSVSSDQNLPTTVPEFNPYPSSMRQKVIQPASVQQAEAARAAEQAKAQAPSEEAPSADIIRLATNNDLSISTIAREAERLQKKQEEDEVVVSLR